MKKTMQTQAKSKGIEVREGRTYLDVSHLNGKISFVYPAKGPNTYVEVAKELEQDNLSQPTMSHNASLIHAAWQNPKEKYSKEVIDILRNNWLWCYNGILYVPNEGAYIQDAPEIKNGRVVMDKSELLKKLEANDSSVRFVPFGYKIGEQSIKELERNAFIIGLVGEEGAEKLAEVSGNYKLKPHLFSFDSVDELKTRVASLVDSRNWGEHRFIVDGDYLVDDRGRHAFGVFNKTGEASPQKN